jgi:hypothetical protein
MSAMPVKSTPKTVAANSVDEQFRALDRQWREETQFFSDPARITRHPAFQAVIALGEEVVPILLRELDRAPTLWVWALPVITGENPVPNADRGQIPKMGEIWVKWGRDKGLV